jgi:hypothetical protein
MPDVFVSYGRADRAHAERIASVLEERGWSVWWDRKILGGEAFSQTIEKELDSSRCVIVLWSASSVASSWVKDEATEGTARNVLVPVLIEDVEIPLGFRQLHTVTLTEPAQVTDPHLFEELVQAVHHTLARSPQTATVAPRAQRGPAPIPRTSLASQPPTVPRAYLYAALAVVAILAILVVRGPVGGDEKATDDAISVETAGTSPGDVTTPEPPASGSNPVASPAGGGASAALSGAAAAVSLGEGVSESAADVSGIVVSGKGQDFYTVFDAGGSKQLSYAKTADPIELFPGDYVVDLHGAKRRVTVSPARLTSVASGTISVSGTGADFFEVYDNSGKTRLSYAKTNGALELFPGDYVIGVHGVTVGATVQAGRDTTVAAGRIVVPGSGSTFYTVFDAKGEKQLTYAKTNAEIELLPGTYTVEMNKTRRTVEVRAGARTVVDR